MIKRRLWGAMILLLGLAGGVACVQLLELARQGGLATASFLLIVCQPVALVLTGVYLVRRTVA